MTTPVLAADPLPPGAVPTGRPAADDGVFAGLLNDAGAPAGAGRTTPAATPGLTPGGTGAVVELLVPPLPVEGAATGLLPSLPGLPAPSTTTAVAPPLAAPEEDPLPDAALLSAAELGLLAPQLLTATPALPGGEAAGRPAAGVVSAVGAPAVTLVDPPAVAATDMTAPVVVPAAAPAPTTAPAGTPAADTAASAGAGPAAPLPAAPLPAAPLPAAPLPAAPLSAAPLSAAPAIPPTPTGSAGLTGAAADAVPDPTTTGAASPTTEVPHEVPVAFVDLPPVADVATGPAVLGPTAPATALDRAAAAEASEQVRPAVAELARGLRDVGGGRASLVVRLDPPELGPVLVRLTVQDGRVDVQLRASEAVAASGLSLSSAEVRSMLAEHGLDLASFDVRHDDQSDAWAGAQPEQRRPSSDQGMPGTDRDAESTGSADSAGALVGTITDRAADGSPAGTWL